MLFGNRTGSISPGIADESRNASDLSITQGGKGWHRETHALRRTMKRLRALQNDANDRRRITA